ncbi:hypothetical protein SD427_19005 (plasmid) [Chryseobacterium sp. JJR-5R]|uniref:hypothetical protein n=1 Tax=Chryseobacterium sp. JJR-5R TaxID=3093923 RepID=UPI002A75A742|nr:hypothetical protein [Chryseobacterium sp. JJR-5R]WPO84619.1 hypothetical protein SD427_19005 [Chryseobacterium sp. JJR-5R]
MEEEKERQILEIIKIKFDKTGGHNGNSFNDFDHILNVDINERNDFLERMAKEKKIKFYMGPNTRMITLPK